MKSRELPAWPSSPAAGARLLVVDPEIDGPRLQEDLADRGLLATVLESTVDALVEVGRQRPGTVIVAAVTVGLPALEFVQAVRRFANPFVVAVVDQPDLAVSEPLIQASSALLERPYDAQAVWEVVQDSAEALGDHVRVVVGPLELDARAFVVKVRGNRLKDLPLKEFELLQALMSHAPDVVSNDELRHAVWGSSENQILDNTLAVHVARLRHRLLGAARIRRLRGRGYALVVD
jgi:DNA-binding response OmpR family regulator